MRLFAITFEERRRRVRRVVAADQAAALDMARGMAGPGGVVLGAAEIAPQALARIDADEGRQCLRFLLSRPFVVLDGNNATVGDWVDRLATNPDEAGPVLAVAGLRLAEDGRLFVAHGGVATLAALFGGTRWAGGLWRGPLACVPGAELAPKVRTLAGVRTRGTLVPVTRDDFSAALDMAAGVAA